jgi:integrase
VGKGKKVRQVPVPVHLVEELREELRLAGLPDDPLGAANASLPLLAAFGNGMEAWGSSGLYKAIKRALSQIASRMDGADAAQVRSASPHWLRHSHASHALNGQADRRPSRFKSYRTTSATLPSEPLRAISQRSETRAWLPCRNFGRTRCSRRLPPDEYQENCTPAHVRPLNLRTEI